MANVLVSSWSTKTDIALCSQEANFRKVFIKNMPLDTTSKRCRGCSINQDTKRI